MIQTAESQKNAAAKDNAFSFGLCQKSFWQTQRSLTILFEEREETNLVSVAAHLFVEIRITGDVAVNAQIQR